MTNITTIANSYGPTPCSSDFEVHAIGVSRELALSRELAKQIEQITDQFGGVVPHSVMSAYQKLKEHYETFNVR